MLDIIYLTINAPEQGVFLNNEFSLDRQINYWMIFSISSNVVFLFFVTEDLLAFRLAGCGPTFMVWSLLAKHDFSGISTG